MDYADYSEELKKICADIQLELAQRAIEHCLTGETLFTGGTTMDRMEALTKTIMEWTPPSERDAAAVRATEIRTISNGRPQFYIPDLGE